MFLLRLCQCRIALHGLFIHRQRHAESYRQFIQGKRFCSAASPSQSIHCKLLSRILRRCLILQASCFCITIVHLIDNIILHMLSIKCYCLVCAGGICDIQNENSLFVNENLTNNGILRHP